MQLKVITVIAEQIDSNSNARLTATKAILANILKYSRNDTKKQTESDSQSCSSRFCLVLLLKLLITIITYITLCTLLPSSPTK